MGGDSPSGSSGGGNLDSSKGGEGRNFRMIRNASRMAKSVVFGFVIIFEKNQGSIDFGACYQWVIRAKSLLGNPMERELFVFWRNSH